MKNLLVIDGNALLTRGWAVSNPFFAIDLIVNNSVAYGITDIVWAFDIKNAFNWRSLYMADYKIAREEYSPRYDYINIVRQLVKDSGQLVVSSAEGDDAVFTIVKTFEKNPSFDKIFIATVDQDFMQLVSNRINILYFSRGVKPKLFEPNDVYVKYGVQAKQFLSYKALMGDDSDGYSGAKGIGKVSAQLLISAYSHISNIYDEIEVDPSKFIANNSEKIYNILVRDKELVYLAYELAQMRLVPVPEELNNTKFDLMKVLSIKKILYKLILKNTDLVSHFYKEDES